MKVQFDLVVSSPLKRSLQTASLISTETGYEQKILLADALAPKASYADFQRLLAECSGHESVLFVGHSPNLVNFLGLLLQPDEARQGGKPAMVRLRKGAIARLSLERGTATLQWLLEPRIVRSLYATSTASSRRKISRK